MDRIDRMAQCPLNVQPKRKNRILIDERQSKRALKKAKQVKYFTKTERNGSFIIVIYVIQNWHENIMTATLIERQRKTAQMRLDRTLS